MTQTVIIQRGDVVRVEHSVARVVDFQRGPQGLSVVMDVNGELRSLDLRDFLESAEVSAHRPRGRTHWLSRRHGSGTRWNRTSVKRSTPGPATFSK